MIVFILILDIYLSTILCNMQGTCAKDWVVCTGLVAHQAKAEYCNLLYNFITVLTKNS